MYQYMDCILRTIPSIDNIKYFCVTIDWNNDYRAMSLNTVMIRNENSDIHITPKYYSKNLSYRKNTCELEWKKNLQPNSMIKTYTRILCSKCGNHVQRGTICGNKYYVQCRKYKKHKTRYNNHHKPCILTMHTPLQG